MLSSGSFSLESFRLQHFDQFFFSIHNRQDFFKNLMQRQRRLWNKIRGNEFEEMQMAYDDEMMQNLLSFE
jgi:hypothetical protein